MILPYACIPIECLPEPLDSAPSPEALAIEHQRHKRLFALFCNLFGADDAAVLVALYFEDSTTALDVAERFGLSENRVNYIRRSALQVLRKHSEIRALLLPTATT